jgi:hypothetical protein
MLWGSYRRQMYLENCCRDYVKFHLHLEVFNDCGSYNVVPRCHWYESDLQVLRGKGFRLGPTSYDVMRVQAEDSRFKFKCFGCLACSSLPYPSVWFT